FPARRSSRRTGMSRRDPSRSSLAGTAAAGGTRVRGGSAPARAYSGPAGRGSAGAPTASIGTDAGSVDDDDDAVAELALYLGGAVCAEQTAEETVVTRGEDDHPSVAVACRRGDLVGGISNSPD